MGSGSSSTSKAWASAVLPREIGRATRIMCWAGRALRWRGAADAGLFARPESPRRCTLPMTAFRVTFPSSAAIWLAERPLSQSFLSCSTRSSDQVNTVIAFFLRLSTSRRDGGAAMPNLQKSLYAESLSPRRAQKARPDVYALRPELLGIRTAARDVVPDSQDATIWPDSRARVRACSPHVPLRPMIAMVLSAAPVSHGLDIGPKSAAAQH